VALILCAAETLDVAVAVAETVIGAVTESSIVGRRSVAEPAAGSRISTT
jgi:hypothetical protein